MGVSVRGQRQAVLSAIGIISQEESAPRPSERDLLVRRLRIVEASLSLINDRRDELPPSLLADLEGEV